MAQVQYFCMNIKNPKLLNPNSYSSMKLSQKTYQELNNSSPLSNLPRNSHPNDFQPHVISILKSFFELEIN